MNANILTPIASLAITVTGLASQPPFSKANRLADSGNFPEAIAKYEESLDREGPAAATFYNLGNTFHAAGKPGLAILAYERAKLAAPRDPDIKANLELVRRETGTAETSPQPVWKRPAYWLSVNGWAIAGSAALAAMAAVSLMGGFGIGVPGVGAGLRRGLFLASAGIGILTTTAVWLRADESDRAIVVASGAPLRISPFENAQALEVLPEGATIQLLREHGGFYQIGDSDGRRGWLRHDEAAPVISPES